MNSQVKRVVVIVALFLSLPAAGAVAGRVVAWGDNSHLQTNIPPGLTDVIAISAGQYHNLALKSDGLWLGGENCDSPFPCRVRYQRRRDSAGGMTISRFAKMERGGWEITDRQGVVPSAFQCIVASSAVTAHNVIPNQHATAIAWVGITRISEGQQSNIRRLCGVLAGVQSTECCRLGGSRLAPRGAHSDPRTKTTWRPTDVRDRGERQLLQTKVPGNLRRAAISSRYSIACPGHVGRGLVAK